MDANDETTITFNGLCKLAEFPSNPGYMYVVYASDVHETPGPPLLLSGTESTACSIMFTSFQDVT